MIVQKVWNKYHWKDQTRYYYKGWYLFGFIPLYVIRVSD